MAYSQHKPSHANVKVHCILTSVCVMEAYGGEWVHTDARRRHMKTYSCIQMLSRYQVLGTWSLGSRYKAPSACLHPFILNILYMLYIPHILYKLYIQYILYIPSGNREPI